MENMSALLRPHAACRSPPLVAASSPLISSTRRSSGHLLQVQQHRRHHRGLSVVSSAVASDTPRINKQAEDWSSPAKEDASSFDWLDQWYPVAPLCDLDPAAPHGKTVLGLNVVAWYDRVAGEWRVFDDVCPHRMASFSEGRIDDKGRLQCVYHGWCFDGAGKCKFIPQAPALGPPVHTNTKACVKAYPCVAQNGILWFYPRTEPEYKDVLQTKRPPFIPELDDPSYHTVYGSRDFPFSYDVLFENVFDPSHLAYAHKGLLPVSKNEDDPGRVEFDKEGGDPIKMKIEVADVAGFRAALGGGNVRFVAPCTYYGSPTSKVMGNNTKTWFVVVAFAVPVAAGKSRLIWAFPRNSDLFLYKLTPRWLYHTLTNRVLDSDNSLLHLQDRTYHAVGLENWHKACYVPATSDRMVVAFRSWFRKHCKNQIGWATPQPKELQPIPPKDQLLERYWSHVVQCSSCSKALNTMKKLEVGLQVASVAIIGFLAVAAKGTLLTSTAQRFGVLSAAVLCFAASRWLADYIQKSFYFQDYVHSEA